MESLTAQRCCKRQPDCAFLDRDQIQTSCMQLSLTSSRMATHTGRKISQISSREPSHADGRSQNLESMRRLHVHKSCLCMAQPRTQSLRGQQRAHSDTLQRKMQRKTFGMAAPHATVHRPVQRSTSACSAGTTSTGSILLDTRAASAQAVRMSARDFLKKHKNSVYSTARVSRGEVFDLPLHASRLARYAAQALADAQNTSVSCAEEVHEVPSCGVGMSD